VRQKAIPIGYSVIGFCGAYCNDQRQLMFRDFLIWKPPGGLKVKLQDYEINPPRPKGIKLQEERKQLESLPSKKFNHVNSTLAHIRKEASTYVPMRPQKDFKALNAKPAARKPALEEETKASKPMTG